MDLYLLSSDFKTLGIIDDFNSLIWRRKYYTVGEFELYLPGKYYTAIREATYLYRNNRPETGVLEAFDVDSGVLTVKGRFLESLLADDIIFPTQSFTNKKSGEIANTLVSDLKDHPVTATSLGNSVTAQVTGDNLMDYTYSLLQTDQLSQRSIFAECLVAV